MHAKMLQLIVFAIIATSTVRSHTMYDYDMASMENCGYTRQYVLNMISDKMDPLETGLVAESTILCAVNTQFDGTLTEMPLDMFSVCDHNADGTWDLTGELLPDTQEAQCDGDGNCCLENCAILSQYAGFFNVIQKSQVIACLTTPSPSPSPAP